MQSRIFLLALALSLQAIFPVYAETRMDLGASMVNGELRGFTLP